jgi:type VI secretion system protein ImpB
MAKEGSVAPKERVNIVYKSSISGTEDVELPLKLLMLGDYTLREDDTPLEERQVINIDKDNFNDVMREQKLNIDLSVRDRISDGSADDDELGVHLKIETLKDFEPEQVVRQVPELNRLLELRQALVSLKHPLGNITAFRKKIQTLLDDDGQRTLLDEIIKNQTDK